MGHISGRIANVRFNSDPKYTMFGFLRDRDGVYVRPRFSFTREFQIEQELTNIVGWLVNPTLSDPNHRNGVLSFAYLLLSSPLGRMFASEAIRQAMIESTPAGVSVLSHCFNMIRDLPRTLAFIPAFGVKRFLLWRRVPGFFQFSKSNCYPIHYHGEQVPNASSFVELSNQRDAVGMRRLNIHFKYTEQDIDSVIKWHKCIDLMIRRMGAGELEYVTNDLRKSVWEQAADGFHQIGTTRMSGRAEDGVVDRECCVHGVDNLFIASSSTFVTSGQANSTFLAVVFALRIADHLEKCIRAKEKVGIGL